ncbi:phosphotransferase [Kineococcus rhizosphaerae]|uniref:Aminoglycoside phosphotransferase (APT) family kinase protein n=1 Tax=Kineococcus rhizosphaerae TaxID=559628 RepID=A0A2T0R444_9ACTN|nr:phosphotransferase [Kineococcus rhizosphaerae]PRY15125.1 aminoglycoside phosphotransferase (APT) family kinase protein [Kineococcus rhizosphaerae]
MPARSPRVLAALATAAVRGLDVVAAGPADADGADFDVAVVVDDGGGRFVVRTPRRAAAAAALDTEMDLLRGLLKDLAAPLPFAVPEVVGTLALPDGGRCVVHPELPGHPLDPGDLRPGPGLAASLGVGLAALHRVDAAVFTEAGVPVYDAEEYRRRRLSELDRAAGTGHVPPRLLTRWEALMEDVTHWRFAATPVHGDLVGEHVRTDGATLTGITGWVDAKVADPADDFAWLAVGADPDALESVLEAYAHALPEPPDPDLLLRARLAGELALARWLLLGLRIEDAEIVEDARRMLDELATHADAHPLG